MNDVSFAIQHGVRGELEANTEPAPWSSFVGLVRALVAAETPCASLTDPEVVKVAKEAMPALVPARFDFGARRSKTNVRGSAIIGLDVDGCTPEAWAGALDKCKGMSILVHTSPTDGLTPGKRKGRIYALADRELAPEEIWPARVALATHLGVREWLDDQTSDGGARIFFAGRLQGTPPRELEVFDGPAVPASALFATYPQAAALVVPSAAPAAHVAPPPVILSAAEHESSMTPTLVALLAAEYARGGRHAKIRALGAVLAQNRWSDEAIRAVALSLPSDKPDARAEQALDAARLARAGERVHQFGTLRDTFGPRLAALSVELAKQPAIFELESAQARAAAPVVDANDPTKDDADLWGDKVVITDLHGEIPPTPWLIEGFNIAPGAPTLLAGYGGLGKSMLAQLFAVCVATGRNVLATRAVRKGRVWHLDYEQGPAITTARYKRLSAALGLERGELADMLEVRSPPRVNLLTPGFELSLMRRCDGIALCLIDSLKAATPGLDEQSSEMRVPLDMLGRVSQKTGCVFLVIHHARKLKADAPGGNQEMRGSSAINDAAQTVIMLESPPIAEGKPAYAGFDIVAGKVRDGRKFDKLGIVLSDTKVEGVPFDALELKAFDTAALVEVAKKVERNADTDIVLGIVAACPGGRFPGSKTELIGMAEQACGSRTRAERAITALKLEGKIYEQTDAGRKTIYTPHTRAP